MTIINTITYESVAEFFFPGFSFFLFLSVRPRFPSRGKRFPRRHGRDASRPRLSPRRKTSPGMVRPRSSPSATETEGNVSREKPDGSGQPGISTLHIVPPVPKYRQMWRPARTRLGDRQKPVSPECYVSTAFLATLKYPSAA